MFCNGVSMPSRIMPEASDCISTAPNIAPAMVPTPPESEVPPITAAAITSSSSSVPCALVEALRRAVEIIAPIARLNAATNAQGTLDELLVIAAAVIGGTSLSGGVGTIAGAMIGAVLMQSLASGMILLGVDTPLQNIVVGLALVVAVWLDTVYRRRVQ